MPFSNGTFSVYTPGNPVQPNTAISSAGYNSTNTDFATGLTQAFNAGVPKAANVTAARALTGANYTMVFIQSADGGLFYRDLTDLTSAEDGGAFCGTIIRPADYATNGVFKRDFSGPVDVVWFGAVADGVTDNSAVILTVGALGFEVVFIPADVKYNSTTVITSLSTDVVLFDLSQINDFQAAGQTSKVVGITSSDTATSDTHWAIQSGHHAIATLNNFGTAGTTSGDERKGSLLWAAGKFQLGSADKRGFRGAAIQQFTKVTGQNFWNWVIRSLAPWASIDGEYEDWAQGQVIAGAGVYRRNGSNQYVSAGAGTTGASPPVHTSGTVSDGGVSWTWIDSADRTLWGIREDGRFQIGSGSYAVQHRHKVSNVDASGSYTFEGESTGVSKVATLKLTPTNAGAVATAQPFLRAEDGVGLRVQRSDNVTDIARFDDDKGTQVKEFAMLHTVAADLDTTPTVEGIGTLYLTNSGATSITTLDDADDNQIVRLVATNANTTLVSSATFLLTGSVNVALTAFSSVTMQRVPNAISARWIEVARSIK